MNETRKRFIPKKRRALDGRVWWCVWDAKRGCWSTFTTHGSSETKSLCQSRIDSSMKLSIRSFTTELNCPRSSVGSINQFTKNYGKNYNFEEGKQNLLSCEQKNRVLS